MYIFLYIYMFLLVSTVKGRDMVFSIVLRFNTKEEQRKESIRKNAMQRFPV